jgi:glycosyltransferase involved in cell wall biosynthesis
VKAITIVICSYNYERFLREAIDSALAQAPGRTRVVVIDDGSTDGSRAIIES